VRAWAARPLAALDVGTARAGLVLALALTAFGVLAAHDPAPQFVAHQDKIEHLAAFALLAFLGARAQLGQGLAACALMGLAVSVEWAQSAFTMTRTASPVDAAFSGAGVALGLLAAFAASRVQRWAVEAPASPRE
jgi:hypothetical protein